MKAAILKETNFFLRANSFLFRVASLQENFFRERETINNLFKLVSLVKMLF